MVRISVITPTFNRAGFIESAVRSVVEQDSPAFEHIVIDGGSSDDTVVRLARYPHLDVVSEPDRGLYDAINKGIRRAHGDVIVLLNSDDRLEPGALAAIAATFDRAPDVMSVCGRVKMGDAVSARDDVELGTPGMQRLRQADIISGLPLTNGRAFRRVVFERIGEFDQQYPVLADRDFLGRYLLSGMTTVVVDQALYRYGIHDCSLSFGSTSGQLAYNYEAVRLASSRLSQSRLAHQIAFYRGWLGWAVGYLLVRAACQRDFGEAYRRSAVARAQFRGWPIAFAAQLAVHVLSRRERRGARA